MPKPENCKFTKNHEWAFIENDIATVGITDFAQSEISDIVFIELPKIGAKVEKDKTCAVIESVKAASDFYAPVSGEVTEINSALSNEPALANKSPHQEGWFFKIKLSNPLEISELLDYNAYQQIAKSSTH